MWSSLTAFMNGSAILRASIGLAGMLAAEHGVIGAVCACEPRRLSRRRIAASNLCLIRRAVVQAMPSRSHPLCTRYRNWICCGYPVCIGLLSLAPARAIVRLIVAHALAARELSFTIRLISPDASCPLRGRRRRRHCFRPKTVVGLGQWSQRPCRTAVPWV